MEQCVHFVCFRGQKDEINNDNYCSKCKNKSDFNKLRSKIDVPKLRILAQKSNVQSSKCTDQFTKCLRQVQWLTRDEIMAMWALKGSFWNKFVPKLWFVGPIYYFLTSKLGCRVPPTFLYKI